MIVYQILFLLAQEGIFTNRASELGIENTGWGWGARFFDADNDLDEDLYVVNGMKVINGRVTKMYSLKMKTECLIIFLKV